MSDAADEELAAGLYYPDYEPAHQHTWAASSSAASSALGLGERERLHPAAVRMYVRSCGSAARAFVDAWQDHWIAKVRRAHREHGTPDGIEVVWSGSDFHAILESLLGSLPLHHRQDRRVYDVPQYDGHPQLPPHARDRLAPRVRGRRVADEVDVDLVRVVRNAPDLAAERVEELLGALRREGDASLQELGDEAQEAIRVHWKHWDELEHILRSDFGSEWKDMQRHGDPAVDVRWNEDSVVYAIYQMLRSHSAYRTDYDADGEATLWPYARATTIRCFNAFVRSAEVCVRTLLHVADAAEDAVEAHRSGDNLLAQLPYELLCDHVLPHMHLSQIASLKATSRGFGEGRPGTAGAAVLSRLPFWRLRQLPGRLYPLPAPRLAEQGNGYSIDATASVDAPEWHSAWLRCAAGRDRTVRADLDPGCFPHHREHIPDFAAPGVQNFVDARKSVHVMVELCTLHKRPKRLVAGLKVGRYQRALDAAGPADNSVPGGGAPPTPVLYRRRFLAVPDGEPDVAERKVAECLLAIKEAEVRHCVLTREHGASVLASWRGDIDAPPPSDDAAVEAAARAVGREIEALYDRPDWPVGELPSDHYANWGPDPDTDPLWGERATMGRLHFLRHELGLNYSDVNHRNQTAIRWMHYWAEPLDPLYERRRVDAHDYFTAPFGCRVELVDAGSLRVVPGDGRGDEGPALRAVQGFGLSFSQPALLPSQGSQEFGRRVAQLMPARSKFLVQALSAESWEHRRTPERAFKLKTTVTAIKRGSGRSVETVVLSPRFFTVGHQQVLMRAHRRAEDRKRQHGIHAESSRRAANEDEEPDAKARRLLQTATAWV